MTIYQVLQQTSSKIPLLEAEILLAHTLKVDKVWLYKNPEHNLPAIGYHVYSNLIKRRLNGEPIPYITNHQEFYGLDFYVDKRVLIPRPETEVLVESVLNTLASSLKPQASIADIGTGSGAIAVTLAKILNSKVNICATDISKDALKVAQINAKKHGVEDRIQFLHGDLLKPLPEKVDIIVANLPYVDLTLLKRPPASPAGRPGDPMTALDGGKDGLELIKKLLHQAPKYLKPKGKIFLEIDPRQKQKLLKIAKFEFKKDLAGLDRVAILVPMVFRSPL